MLSIRIFKYNGDIFTNDRNNKVYILDNPDRLSDSLKLIKDNTYVGIVIKNKPKLGVIKLAIDNKPLCVYAKEKLDKKDYDVDNDTVELYKRICIEDKVFSRYVYKNFKVKNKLMIDPKDLVMYIYSYIDYLCKKNNEKR